MNATDTKTNVLNHNLFLVKEHLGLFKAANNFDIYDPESGDLILECREDKLGWLTKLLRFTDYKRHTPFHIELRQPGGPTLISVRRGVSILVSTVRVYGQSDSLLGVFKQKLLSIGGKFSVLDPQDQPLFELKGNWTGWDFRFLKNDAELARVSKQWAGLGKELFTSADNYMLEISDQVPQNDAARALILAAVMCIDMVLKE